MAHYSLTPRVHVLAERLLSHKSTLCTEHAATLNALDGDIAGIPPPSSRRVVSMS